MAQRIRINNEFVRKPIEDELLSETAGRLKLDQPIDPAKDVGKGKPISTRAYHEAVAAENGFNNLNYGFGADTYGVRLRNRAYLVVAGEDRNEGVQRFVVLSPKKGSVVGRGFAKKDGDHAKITWTRSHNGHTAHQPVEVNDTTAKVHQIRGGGPGLVNHGKLDASIEDLQGQWGDENIMDGMVGLAGTIVANGNARDTAVRDLEGLRADGSVDALEGDRAIEGPRRATRTDIDALALAVNSDGFQYANRGEVPRIRRQIASILKKLGGPEGLEVAVIRQNAKVEMISDTDTFPVQVWAFRNPRTDDAVTFYVRKGSL